MGPTFTLYLLLGVADCPFGEAAWKCLDAFSTYLKPCSITARTEFNYVPFPLGVSLQPWELESRELTTCEILKDGRTTILEDYWLLRDDITRDEVRNFVLAAGANRQEIECYGVTPVFFMQGGEIVQEHTHRIFLPAFNAFEPVLTMSIFDVEGYAEPKVGVAFESGSFIYSHYEPVFSVSVEEYCLRGSDALMAADANADQMVRCVSEAMKRTGFPLLEWYVAEDPFPDLKGSLPKLLREAFGPARGSS